VNIYAGGSINAGSQELIGGDNFVRGIYTSGHSDIHVIAQGNIDVAGSRIAAFDGGNVFVESLKGDVNAGSGGLSTVATTEVTVDPVTYKVTIAQQPIVGSGILATTLPDSPPSETVGNITVLTPRGSILASEGGISQVPENGNSSLTPTITLIAGTRDANGSVVYAGNIEAGTGGVIGINTTLEAAGNISGLVVASGNANINAAANVSGTFLAGGTANLDAAGTVSGIAIAGGGINVGSGTVSGMTMLSQNVSVGNAQGPSGLASGTTASTTSQTAAGQEQAEQKAETTQVASDDTDEKKRGGKRPFLAKSTGRVTVILPGIAR
jgi:hypothetical protein